MTEKLIALLANCLVIFAITAVGDGMRRQHPPATVRVRLVQVETNADLIDAPMNEAKISLDAGGAHFDLRTNKDGVVVFDNVPCGGQIAITARSEADEPTVFHRRLICRAGTVNLGVITYVGGGRPSLQQRRTTYYGYDPAKNVWRDKDGRIVSFRVIRRILARNGM